MINYESISKCEKIYSDIFNSSLGCMPNNMIIDGLSTISSYPSLVFTNDVLRDFSLFSINTQLVEKLISSARLYGFNNSEINEIVEKEQNSIFDASEEVLGLTQNSLMSFSRDYIQNQIENKIVINIISKLKKKKIDKSKVLKKNIEQLAIIASVIYYRIFLENPPYVAA